MIMHKYSIISYDNNSSLLFPQCIIIIMCVLDIGHAFVGITMCSLTLFMQVIFVLTYDLRNSIPYRSNLYRYVIVKVQGFMSFTVL